MNLFHVIKEQFGVLDGKIRPLDEPHLCVEDELTQKGSLVIIERSITNIGNAPITFIPSISVQTENAVTDWFVPSVSYSGNAFGDGMEPKGLRLDGEPWIFPSDHAGVPGCTVVMGEHGSTALFLSPECVSSACSLTIKENSVIQRAFFTHIEYPKAYIEKLRYGDAILETIILEPGEKRHFTAYLFLSDERGTFGYRSFIDYLLTDYTREPIHRDTSEIYEYSMSFLRALLQKDTPAGTLTNMGFLPREKVVDGVTIKEFVYRRSGRYECGWCGQNISNAWLLLWDHMKKNGFSIQQKTPVAPFDLSFAVKGSFDITAEDYQNAIGILDTWMKYRLESGLIPVLLDDVFKGKTNLTFDLCNLGWLVYQYLNCYVLLKNGGIERKDYLETARGVLDAVIAYPALGNGFPQTVNEKGEIVCALGMAGAMMTVAALQMYRITEDEHYLIAGKQSFDFYYDHYLARNVAAGAALDTYCIDKESAGPVLRSALMLERLTGDSSYLTKAENIACYLQTWMFYYDIPFPSDTDAAKTGFTTLGATAVSAQHNHLDCWASYYVPDLRYLAVRTKNFVWRRAADYLREYTYQGISDGKTELHGLVRPAGAQNEAIFQSNWTFDGRNAKGQFNDWLVSWVNAFRLMDMNHAEMEDLQK